jgi:hypothetical protein
MDSFSFLGLLDLLYVHYTTTANYIKEVTTAPTIPDADQITNPAMKTAIPPTITIAPFAVDSFASCEKLLFAFICYSFPHAFI